MTMRARLRRFKRGRDGRIACEQPAMVGARNSARRSFACRHRRNTPLRHSRKIGFQEKDICQASRAKFPGQYFVEKAIAMTRSMIARLYIRFSAALFGRPSLMRLYAETRRGDIILIVERILTPPPASQLMAHARRHAARLISARLVVGW